MNSVRGFDEEYHNNEFIWNIPMNATLWFSQMYKNDNIIIQVTNNIYNRTKDIQHNMKIIDYNLYLIILENICIHINFVKTRIREPANVSHFVIFFVIKSMCAHYFVENNQISEHLLSVL